MRQEIFRTVLVICLRWVSESYEVFEDMVGLVQLENTTAESIYISLKNCLLCLGISFDGARNFQGHVSGVAKRFLNDNAAAIPVHCLAHCVNLSLQEVARSSKSIKEGLNTAMNVRVPLSLFKSSKNLPLNQESEAFVLLDGLFALVQYR